VEAAPLGPGGIGRAKVEMGCIHLRARGPVKRIAPEWTVRFGQRRERPQLPFSAFHRSRASLEGRLLVTR
jgi:hypothetical protein